jgi:hypothetical protein
VAAVDASTVAALSGWSSRGGASGAPRAIEGVRVGTGHAVGPVRGAAEARPEVDGADARVGADACSITGVATVSVVRVRVVPVAAAGTFTSAVAIGADECEAFAGLDGAVVGLDAAGMITAVESATVRATVVVVVETVAWA